MYTTYTVTRLYIDNGQLRIGMECGYAPFNWTQQDDSNGAVAIEGGGGYANGTFRNVTVNNTAFQSYTHGRKIRHCSNMFYTFDLVNDGVMECI